MPLYYSDPNREPRDCRQAWALNGSCYLPVSADDPRAIPDLQHPERCDCGGTGRLGVEGAEPDVEIERIMGAWAYRFAGGDGLWDHTDADTPDEALTAARAAAEECMPAKQTGKSLSALQDVHDAIAKER